MAYISHAQFKIYTTQEKHTEHLQNIEGTVHDKIDDPLYVRLTNTIVLNSNVRTTLM